MKKITFSRETHRWLLVNFPLCSDRFIENLAILGFYRAGFDYTRLLPGDTPAARVRSAKEDRRYLQYRYHSGALRLKPLIEIARKALDEKNLELFLKSLFRKKKGWKD